MRRLFFILREFDGFCGKRGLPRLLGAGSSFEIQTFPIILTDNFLSGDDCYHIAIFSEIQRNDFAVNRMKKLYDYALYPESFTANSANNKSNCRFSVYINNKWVKNVGKISNAALDALQKNPKDTEEAGTASRKVSAMVLAYLDSADKNNARYTFYDGKVITTVQSQVRILIKHQSPRT